MTNQVRSKCINEAFKAVLDHPKDVTIVSAENQIFYVNRLLLSLFSSTLSSLLSSPTCSPSSIILPDCSISSIKQLFDILQKGFTSINKVDGSKVIETAGILGISIDKLNTNNEKENNVDKNNEKDNNADKNTPFSQMRKRYRSGPEKRDVETADILGISIDKLNTNSEKEINSNKNTPFSQMRKRYRSGPEKRDVEDVESKPLLKKRHKSGSSNQNKKLRSEELMNLSEESVVHKNPLKHQPQHPPKKQQEKQQIQTKPKQQIIPTPKKQIPPQAKPQISPKKKQQISPQEKQQIPPQPKQQIQPHQMHDTPPKQKHLEMHPAPLQLKPQISLQEQQPSEDILSEVKEVSKIDMSKDNSAQAQTVKIQWDIFDEVCLTVKDAPIEVDTPQSNARDNLEETPGASGYGLDKENAATIRSKGNQINEKSILVENQQPIVNINIPKTCSNQIQAIIANTNETPIPTEIQKTIIKKDVLKEVFSSVKDEAIKINDVPCNETPQNKDIQKKTVDTKDADYKNPDQLYLCQICSKDIPRARLRVHYSGHFVKEMKQYENLTKENECLICNKKFSNKQSSLRHIGMAHEKLDEFLVEKGMVPIKNKNESRKPKSITKDKVITLNKHENSTVRDDLSLMVTKEFDELELQVIPEKGATGISQNLNEIVDKLTVINQNNHLNTESVDLQKPTNNDLSKRLTNEKNIPMEIQENVPIKIEPVQINDTLNTEISDTLNTEKNIPEDPKSITKHTLQTTINQDILDKVCLSIKDEPVDYNQDEVPNIETNALVEIPLTTINRDVLDKVCLAIKDEPTLMEENSEMESSHFEMETIIDKETLDTICSGIKEEPLNLKRSCQISVKDCLSLVKENQCIHCKKIFFHKKILRRHIGMAHKKDDNKKDYNETISERGVLPINKRFENTRVDKGKKRNSVNKKKNILQGSKLPPKHRHRRYEK